MSAEVKKEIQLEIAHVLFVDIVGYSKLRIDEQRSLLETLNRIVRATDQFQSAEAAGKLSRIPTGDGMALLFYSSLEAPVECALEISRALKTHPELQLRMGVHSGPVSGVVDVNDRANVAGVGINLAQRVMDCGDVGHILLSQRVAEDLAQYGHWQPHLHDLGECEVKHGTRVSLVNLYTADLGNPEVPAKCREAATKQKEAAARGSRTGTGLPRWTLVGAVVVSVVAIAAALLVLQSKRSRTAENAALDVLSDSAMPPGLAIPQKSIAVLPFENRSDEKESAYFTDGVQDEILTELARIADLKVISRTSVMQYKSGKPRNVREIGRQLGVAHLLEGSVQRSSKQVRVNAQLIDALRDGHLWAEKYDGPLDDVFAIQSEIAKKIAGELHAKLSPSEKAAIETPPTRDLAAYDLYLRARVLYSDTSNTIHAREKIPEAGRLLDQAVARDPQFLLAWCLLSRVHANIYWIGYDHTPERLDLANAAVQAALRLRPDSGEARLALADYYYHGFRDYERARKELAIARRTLPNNSEVFEYSGYIERRDGRWEEATRDLERALELDPRNLLILQQLALAYQAQRRYEDVARTYDRVLTITPGDPFTRIARSVVPFDWRADIKPFQTTLATLIAEDPRVGPDVDDVNLALCEGTPVATKRALTNYPREGAAYNGVNYSLAYWEGVVAFCERDLSKSQTAFSAARAEVQKIADEQPNFAAALSLLGLIDAGLGRKDEALRAGRRACELMPMTKDAIDGVALAVNLALIYAWTGEKDLAIQQIAAVERVPNYLSYGFLKLHPQWNALRGDPRFETIVASLAPKEEKK